MENQEPVYVLSGQLSRVCEAVLARIYDRRQTDKENYVTARTQAYNQAIHKSNRWRKKLGFLGVAEKPYITPVGMEYVIKDEIEALDGDAQVNHPMVQIHRQYGGAEHDARDAILQCRLNDTVCVSQDFIRCVSHLGVDFAQMTKRPKVGFVG